MSRFAKDSVMTGVTQVLLIGLGFAYSILLARGLGAELRGAYGLLILILTLMLKFGNLGLDASVVYYSGNKKYSLKDVVGNIYSVVLILSSLVIGVYVILRFNPTFNAWIETKLSNKQLLDIVVYLFPFALAEVLLAKVLLGNQLVSKYNKYSIIKSIAKVVILFCFLIVFDGGLVGAIFAYSVLSVLCLLVLIYLIKKHLHQGLALSLNKDFLRDSLVYGGKAYLGNCVQFLNYRLDMVIITAMLPLAELGFYSVGVTLMEKIWLIPSSVALVLFPKVSSEGTNSGNRLTPIVCRNTLLITGIAAVGLGINLFWVIPLLFGQEYMPVVMVCYYLLPGIVMLSISKVLTSDLAGRGKVQYGSISSVVSFVFNTALNLLLIPKIGILGAALASSVAYSISTIVVIGYYVRETEIALSSLLLVNRKDFEMYRNMVQKVKTRLLAS